MSFCCRFAAPNLSGLFTASSQLDSPSAYDGRALSDTFALDSQHNRHNPSELGIAASANCNSSNRVLTQLHLGSVPEPVFKSNWSTHTLETNIMDATRHMMEDMTSQGFLSCTLPNPLDFPPPIDTKMPSKNQITLLDNTQIEQRYNTFPRPQHLAHPQTNTVCWSDDIMEIGSTVGQFRPIKRMPQTKPQAIDVEKSTLEFPKRR